MSLLQCSFGFSVIYAVKAETDSIAVFSLERVFQIHAP